MAQPNNTNPVPVEERLGLEAGVLLQVRKNRVGMPDNAHVACPARVYDIDALTRGEPVAQTWRGGISGRILDPEEFFLFVRRTTSAYGEHGRRAPRACWVLYSPKEQKNVVIFNRAFWKWVDVVSRPEKEIQGDL